ncbi:MAG: hypothetical protein FK730_02135 [Asgard group archaeon]|nr:hypothetical protein [Asgard group archaeon]
MSKKRMAKKLLLFSLLLTIFALQQSIVNNQTVSNGVNSFEHWYDVYGTGLDSNESITWWYSGYSDLEKRAALGWGGKYRFCYLDPSARSWYLDYTKTAWTSMGGYGSELYYNYPDLDALTQAHDPNTPEGKEILNQYLSEWINTYLGNVFSGPVFSDLPIGNTISLQVLVLNNLTANGYPVEDLDWCISQNRIFNQLKIDFPWIDWEIKLEWAELSDYPQFANYIHDNIKEDVNGKYIDVQEGLYDLLEGELGDHFNLSAAEVVLPCYFFLTDDISFRWLGVSFAGLGGMGWEILLASQNRLFQDGIIGQPRRGFSNVMIHELGHSLGLPHPHSATYGWGSSFVSDVMSYFAYDDCFSVFYQDAIGRSHTDANFAYAIDDYAIALDLYNDTGKPVEMYDTMVEINDTLDLIPVYYHQMDYNSSAYYSFHLRDLLDYAIDYLETKNNQKIDFYQPEATYREENLTLKIDLIGFNQNLINETAIELELYDTFRHSGSIPLSELHFNFEFNYVSEIDRQELEDYIVSIADSGEDTGYEIDIPLLQQDLVTGARSNIFIPRDGMSIDAELVNEYFYDNLYQEPVEDPGYTFYLMNFSNFDSNPISPTPTTTSTTNQFGFLAVLVILPVIYILTRIKKKTNG